MHTLKKIIYHLLDHAATVEHPDDGWRTVTLNIAHTTDRCLFSVMDVGGDAPTTDVLLLESEPSSNSTELPVIFQRYHQQVLPAEMVDFEATGSLRDKIESGINSAHNNSVGLGLSLFYHLVMALGGDLRYSSQPNVSKFWFSLPHNNGELESEQIVISQPKPVQGGQNRVLDMEQLEKKRLSVYENKVCQRWPQSNGASLNFGSGGRPYVRQAHVYYLASVQLPYQVGKEWQGRGGLAAKGAQCLQSHSHGFEMPIMDGLTETKIIKEELHLEILVVALTGEGGDDTQELCTEFGCDAYYNKPMRRDQLIRVIQEQTGHVVNDTKSGSMAEAA